MAESSSNIRDERELTELLLDNFDKPLLICVENKSEDISISTSTASNKNSRVQA